MSDERPPASMEVLPAAIAGCLILTPRVRDDASGRFVEVYRAGARRELGVEVPVAWCSTPRRGGA